MKGVAFVVTMTAIVALFVGSINQEHITYASKSQHVTFATNKGINVQTSTTQDQGCESAGGTSGITTACSATSTPGSGMQTSVSLFFGSCFPDPSSFQYNSGGAPQGVSCSNIGCTSISCNGNMLVGATANCITNNGVQLTCTGGSFAPSANTLFCTRTEPGTGITNSGGITGSDGR